MKSRIPPSQNTRARIGSGFHVVCLLLKPGFGRLIFMPGAGGKLRDGGDVIGGKLLLLAGG